MKTVERLFPLPPPARWLAFLELCQRGAQVQQEFALDLIRDNAQSWFGRRHSFCTIGDLASYRKAVPIRSWGDFAPLVERIANGEPDVLISGAATTSFILTTGTTGKPKLIPQNLLTEQISEITLDIRRQAIHRDHPELLAGKLFSLSVRDCEGHTPAGIPFGYASGARIKKGSARASRLAYPLVIREIADAESRLYTALRLALVQPVTAIGINNPGGLGKLADFCARFASELIADLRQGRLRPPKPLAPAVAEQLQPALTAEPARADELAAVAHAGLKPGDIWPTVKLVICWKTGIMSRYIPTVKDLVPAATVFREWGYGASEGLFSIVRSDHSSAGSLAIHGAFFEFLPEDVPVRPDAETLLAHELEPGKNYQLILSAPSGLYRYAIGDLVQVTGYEGQTPSIVFLRKIGDITNLLSERITLEQVTLALDQATLATGVELRHFQWLANMESVSYELCVEPISVDISDSRWRQFLAQFELALKLANPIYGRRRHDGFFKLPTLRLMKGGWLAALQQQAGSSGLSQFKPRMIGYKLCAPEWSERVLCGD